MLLGLWYLCPLQCTFFALFAFDALGDEVGASAALWAPLLLLSIAMAPTLAYTVKLAARAFIAYMTRLRDRRNESEIAFHEVYSNQSVNTPL